MGKKWVLNPDTGKLNARGLTEGVADARYLKLDQSTPQTVTGQPRFMTSGTITRIGGMVSAITIGGRTKTYSRNASGFVTSMSDGQNVWTYVRDVNNNLLSWSVA